MKLKIADISRYFIFYDTFHRFNQMVIQMVISNEEYGEFSKTF